jgi:chromosome partitioning protein
MRILLIQDAGDVSRRLTRVLEQRGHKVKWARDREGLRRSGQAADYDLILLDMRIATLDPLAFLESQRRFGQVWRTLLLSLDDDLCEEISRLGIAAESVIGDAHDLAAVAEIVERVGHTDTCEPDQADEVVDGDTAELDALGKPGRRSRGASGRVVVVASHKGGTGKSTLSMHLVVGYMQQGLSVACVDLDQSQLSLTRFWENRGGFARSHGIELAMPAHIAPVWDEGDLESLQRSLLDLRRRRDVVIVDCPAGYAQGARVAIALADVLVTPINDSFVDLDLLAVLEPKTLDFRRLGPLGQVVSEARQRVGQVDHNRLDWVVLRNRLTSLGAHNKEQMADALAALSERLDFRQGEGLSERVIYRELFLEGLTLLDLRQAGLERRMSLSHVAARQELRGLLNLISQGGDRAPDPRQAVA